MDIKPIKKNFETIVSKVAAYAPKKKRAPRSKKKEGEKKS